MDTQQDYRPTVLSYEQALGEMDVASVLDDIVGLATSVCQTPIAAIYLLDGKRQWVKTVHGMTQRQRIQGWAFCHDTMRSEDLLVVEDASTNSRFQENPLGAAEPTICFFAGVPILSHCGHKLGSLCIFDLKPQQLSATQRKALTTLGQCVERELLARAKLLETGRKGKASLIQNKPSESNSMPIIAQSRVFDAWEVISVHLHAMNALAEQKGIQLALTGERPMVMADPALLLEIVENLVTNALTHGAGTTKITVSLAMKGNYALLTVQDNGPGLSKAAKDVACLPGYREGQSDLTDRSGGGLAFCKQAASAQGGSLWLRDNEPTGLVVGVQLPMLMS